MQYTNFIYIYIYVYIHLHSFCICDSTTNTRVCRNEENVENEDTWLKKTPDIGETSFSDENIASEKKTVKSKTGNIPESETDDHVKEESEKVSYYYFIFIQIYMTLIFSLYVLFCFSLLQIGRSMKDKRAKKRITKKKSKHTNPKMSVSAKNQQYVSQNFVKMNLKRGWRRKSKMKTFKGSGFDASANYRKRKRDYGQDDETGNQRQPSGILTLIVNIQMSAIC